MSRILALSASRSLSESALAWAWAHDHMTSLLLGLQRGDVLLTAGTAGLEVAAEVLAHRLGHPTVVFHADGRRDDSRKPAPGRWLGESLKASSRQRDEAIAQACAKAQAKGWNVRCVGFLDAAAGERSGTAYRLGLLESAGLPVRRMVWSAAVTTTEEAAPVAAE